MAASAPPTPTEAKALISDPTASLCGNFVKTLLRLPVLFYNLIYWLLDDTGEGVRTFRAGDKIESFTPLTEDTHRKLCNGQALDKTTYAVLFAAIGSTFDTMDGQSAPGGNLFRVPKCGARFALAVGSLPSSTAVTLGGVGGEETHTLLDNEIPKHSHDVWPADDGDTNTGKLWSHFDPGGESDTADKAKAIAPNDDNSTTTKLVAEETATGDDAHNNMPPYYGIYVYIVTGI